MGIYIPRCQQKSMGCHERPGSSFLFFSPVESQINILGFDGPSSSVSVETSQLCPSSVKATRQYINK